MQKYIYTYMYMNIYVHVNVYYKKWQKRTSDNIVEKSQKLEYQNL